jgi:uncharacterized membrane protein
MTFESSKTLGGIGALLLFISVFLSPIGQVFVGGAVAIVGLILILISLYGLANFYSDRLIFNNALYGVLSGIVGAVVAGAVLVFTVLTNLTSFLQTIYPSWNGTDWNALQGLTPDTSNISPSAILPFIGGILLVFVVMWVFAIVATFFIRRSLKEVSVRSTTGLFSTAGLLMLVGAALIIIFGLGLLLIWIATLLLTIAFFTMKAPQPVTEPTTTYTPPPTSV